MALEQLTLTLTSEGYEYQIYPLDGVDDTQTKSAVSIAPPGSPPSGNILLGISGMEADLSIRFFMHDDGTDKANGTAPTGDFANDTVVTLAEQREWLKDYIHAPGFDASWTLTHDTGDFLDGEEFFVERVEVPFLQQDSPKWVECTIDLRRGSSI